MSRPSVRVSRRGLLAGSLAAGALGATAPLLPRPVRAGRATPAAGVVGDHAALFRELGDFVRRRMAVLGVPGVAIGVIAGGEEYVAGYGVTNVEQPRPVDADTLFSVGSLTKTFTGTALMRLVEQGKVDLAAPVRTSLPDFRVGDADVSEKVTLRHLVTHTAGWFGDDFTDTGAGDDALARFVAGMAELPQIAPLGEHFSYNNGAVAVAGRVIEVATGRPYEAALDELVLRPLGLERTSFPPGGVITDEASAVGHGAADGGPVVLAPPAIPRAANPVGGLASSVGDQLRWARFHLGDETGGGMRVLSPSGRRRMREPLGPGGAIVPYLMDGVGVTWWLLARPAGGRVVAHLGSSDGLESSLVLVPERGFAVAVLTNAQAGMALGVEVTNRALERFLGLAEPPLGPVPAPPRMTEYVGDYSVGGGAVIRIEEREGALVLAQRVPGQAGAVIEAPLRFVGADLVALEQMGLTLLSDFVRNDRGEIGWFRFNGRLCPREA